MHSVARVAARVPRPSAALRQARSCCTLPISSASLACSPSTSWRRNRTRRSCIFGSACDSASFGRHCCTTLSKHAMSPLMSSSRRPRTLRGFSELREWRFSLSWSLCTTPLQGCHPVFGASTASRQSNASSTATSEYAPSGSNSAAVSHKFVKQPTPHFWGFLAADAHSSSSTSCTREPPEVTTPTLFGGQGLSLEHVVNLLVNGWSSGTHLTSWTSSLHQVMNASSPSWSPPASNCAGHRGHEGCELRMSSPSTWCVSSMCLPSTPSNT
mmetsp:Transcript_7387/g.20993  ORF Transcript_7387/g.20993 Transcript_7387/m.20993 type:complete len:270 (+) Transcript_7387:1072-1881(+)